MSKPALIPFPYYGGKCHHIDFLTSLMPPSNEVNLFADVFGGGAHVVLNVEYRYRVYNDIDKDLVNFFRVLRDSPDELIKQIALTLYAREELVLACEPTDDPVEKARRFFVKVKQSRFGRSQVTGRQWKRSTKSYPWKPLSETWSKSAEGLAPIAHALTRIQVENEPAVKVIEDYDSPTNFFYCDPPYVLSTRSGGKAYRYEMSDEEHRALATALNNCEAKVMVSGYKGGLYDELFSAGRWQRIDDKEKFANSSKDIRQESVWINYQPPKEALL